MQYNPSLSLLHINARSLNQNQPKLVELLNTIVSSFSAIGITETWLKKTHSESTNVFIESYNFIHNSKDKIGGGVGFFIENNTQYKQRHDLDFFDHQVFESMFIEIVRLKQSNINIGTIYRPPDANLAEFNLKIDGYCPKSQKIGNHAISWEIVILIY